MKGLYRCYFCSFTCVLCVCDIKGTWMFSLFLPLCLEELASLIFGAWQRESLALRTLFTENPRDISQRLRVSWCCLNNTSWRIFCSWNECLYFLLNLRLSLKWSLSTTAWGRCRGKFLVAIINSSQIKKKAMPRWAVISNTIVKHNEHADQK